MYKISWKNLIKRKFNFLLTVLTVAIASAVLFSSLILTQGVLSGISSSINKMGADIIVTPVKEGEFKLPSAWGGGNGTAEQLLFTGNPVNIYMDQNIQGRINEVPGIKQTTAQFFTQTLDESCCSLEGTNRLVGIEQKSDFVIEPWLQKHLKGNLKDDQVIVGGFAPAPLGEKVTILGRIFTIADRLDPVGGSIDTTIFIPIDTARELAGESPYLKNLWKQGEKLDSLVSAILVKVNDTRNVKEIAANINQIEGVKANVASDVMRSTKEQFSTLVIITGGLGVFLWVICFLGLISRYTSLIIERKKELGLLRALGARKGHIFKIIMVENLITIISGGIIGLFSGGLIVYFSIDQITSRTAFPFHLPPWLNILELSLLTLSCSIIVGFLASFYPSYHCANLDPVRAISEGELE